MRYLAQFVIGMLVLVLFVSSGLAGPIPESQPELTTAKTVAVKYYLSLPQGWTATKTWPILVTIDGSGHGFLGNCQNFVKARGGLPFIIVTPCVTSNGNDPGELRAVLAIVKEVQEDKQGQSKFFVTGFSAGGHMTWQIILMHPELLAGAAPAAGNFRSRGIADVSNAKERVQLPIHGFQGDKDGFIVPLNQQWNDAEALARQHGYKDISRTMVPGAGHQTFAPQVVNFFSTLLPSPDAPAGAGASQQQNTQPGRGPASRPSSAPAPVSISR